MLESLSVLRAELFKFRRRPMPWILLSLLLALTQIQMWGARSSYLRISAEKMALPVDYAKFPEFSEGSSVVNCRAILEPSAASHPPGTDTILRLALHDHCAQWLNRQDLQLGRLKSAFTVPGSLFAALRLAGSVGLLLVAVLTATAIGTEFSLGTLRPILATGMHRSAFLGGKLLAIVAAVSVGIAIVLCVAALTSSVVSALVSILPVPVPSPESSSVALTSGRVVLGMIPFAIFTGMVGVISRSSSVAIATSLGYFMAELFGAARLSAGVGQFSDLGRYLLVCNTHVFSGVGPTWGSTAACLTDGGARHAAIVLLIYSISCGSLALLVFSRRDLAGPRGD